MNGPEHYLEAERLLAHATLALAAATALNDTDPNGEGMPGLDCRAWWQAAGATS